MFDLPFNIVPIRIQLEFFLRILLAAGIGATIGYERKNRLKEAGVRTHLIVCLGSALIMVVSKYGFADIVNTAGYRIDPSRIASQIVSGIGFLGTGMIFVRKQSVSGLTTAAGVWATAGVGMAIGSGMYFIGIVSAGVIILLQVLLRKRHDLFHIPFAETIELRVLNRPDVIKNLRDVLREKNIEIFNLKVEKVDELTIEVDLLAKFPYNFEADQLMILFNDLDYIISVEL